MKHYVIIHDYAAESGKNHDDVSSGTEIVGIAHSHDKAKEKLAKASADERQYAKENGWVVQVDSDEAFAAGEANNYDREHTDFYIEEIDEDTDLVVPSELLDKVDKIEESTLNHYRGSITRDRYVTDVKVIRKTISDYITRREPSDTDFMLIKKLADAFTPATWGIISSEERELVESILELEVRNVRELRNLRNTFVMFSDISTKSCDFVSAVTFVIDDAIARRGGEV